MKVAVLCFAFIFLEGMAEAANFVGKITKVAVKSFTVKGGGQTKEFVVAEQTVFQKGSTKVSFRELKIGQEVTVVFREEEGRAVAQQVSIASGGEKERHHARE